MVTSMSISMRSTTRSMSISMRSITTKSTNTKSIMKSTNTKSITKRSMHHHQLHLHQSTRSMQNPRAPHLLQSQHLLHSQPLLSQALLPQIPRTGNSHKYTIKYRDLNIHLQLLRERR